MSHTPGPWSYRNAVGAGLQIEATLPAGFRGSAICRTAGERIRTMLFELRKQTTVQIADEQWVQFSTNEWDEMQEANARLISAAPELLEACKSVLAVGECLEKPDDENQRIYLGKRTIEKLRAAISKAEGKA